MKLNSCKKLWLVLVSYVSTFAGCNALHTSLRDSTTKLEENNELVDSSRLFSNQFAVHISGGDQIAEHLADRHGFVNLGKIFDDYFLFKHKKVAKRSIKPELNHTSLLHNEPQVNWVRQQTIKRRVKRGGQLESKTVNTKPSRNPNDPLWHEMWYLNRGHGLDMNVQQAWTDGITGKGVVVTILDDGLEINHPDLRRNYDPLASYDLNGHDNDPIPRYDEFDSNRHGTRCAGEVAATGNNSLCGIGVAFNANIGGVRMLDGEVTDAVEARALTLNPQHVDIYSASWGPEDDGKTVEGPGELATRAFIYGVLKGRNGKGSIFVWASGNGGKEKDNCNCDGYTNSIWTLSISSVTEQGTVPWYSESCSSTLASTYSSGSLFDRQIVTTDLHSGCTANHTGTSASAPLAAGICALALEANPNLTWRDMQHIVVRTARSENLQVNDWQFNGAGRKVSHLFGYGLMDAGAMVRLARNWTTVSPQRYCEMTSNVTSKVINGKSQFRVALHVSACREVNFMEHVQIKITLDAPVRGDIQIFLTSPSGTRSTLLARRPNDNSPYGFHSWPFMSVHFWGEAPIGHWTLDISNEGRYPALLDTWGIIIYGTREIPDANEFVKPVPPHHQQNVQNKMSIKNVDESIQARLPDDEDFSEEVQQGNVTSSTDGIDGRIAWEDCRPGHWDHFTAICLLCDDGFYLWEGRCVTICPTEYYPEMRVELADTLVAFCLPCHYSCFTCSGPNDYECTSCQPDLIFKNPYSDAHHGNTERVCHPRELLDQLTSYERWSLVVNTFLSFNLFALSCIIIYKLLYKKRNYFSSGLCRGWAKQDDAEARHTSPVLNTSFNHLALYAQKPKTPEDLEASSSLLSKYISNE